MAAKRVLLSLVSVASMVTAVFLLISQTSCAGRTLEGKVGVLIRSSEVRPEVKEQIAAELRTLLGAYTEVRFESAGATIGQEVSQSALYAIGASN